MVLFIPQPQKHIDCIFRYNEFAAASELERMQLPTCLRVIKHVPNSVALILLLPVGARMGHGRWSGGSASLSLMLDWPLQSGVSQGSVEEICLQQQAQIWELVSVLYSDISREPPLARRLEGKALLYNASLTRMRRNYR